MTITMTLAEYELLKAQAAKPDKGMEELEKWNSFLDTLSRHPSLLLDILKGDPTKTDPLGGILFTLYKQQNELLHSNP